MISSEKCEDDCVPPWVKRSSMTASFSAMTLSTIPFAITFLFVNVAVLYKLFPLVSGLQQSEDEEDHYLPSDAPSQLKRAHVEHGQKSARRRIVALSFSTTIALAAVLTELILCEISDMLNPTARSVAIAVTVPTLLFFLVILIPFLELQSIISGAGWSFKRTGNGRIPRVPWILQLGGFAGWLGLFWWLGMASGTGKGLSEACLERVGIIGISLMALLSGFAAVSSVFQTFGAKQKTVTESDIARKQAGLDATNEILVAKRSRLRALQRKVYESPSESFMTKVIGSIRGGGDVQEIKALELEISGLASMEHSLSSSLTVLQTRLVSNRRSSSPYGRLFLTPTTYAFALYCIFRIFMTSIATLRRTLFPSPDSTTFNSSSTDPINRSLSLLAKYVSPTLDQLAWSRQISFLLSGFILLASFNSVIQTFHMLTKLSPSLLYQAQANLALIIAQISATYVISSALLLRSNLPPEMKSLVSAALGSPLEPGFVERWFEGWFLLASIATALGIWLGRKFSSSDWDDWELEGEAEMGPKRA